MKLNKLTLATMGLYLASSCGHHTDEATIEAHKKHQTLEHAHDSHEHEENHHEEDTHEEHAHEHAMPTPMLGEATAIVIGSPQYDKMVEFYSILGWEIQATGEEPWNWTSMFDGSTMLTINEDTASYFAPDYYSSNAEEVYAKLESLHVPSFMSFPKEDGSDWFRVYDSPDSMAFTVTNEAKETMEIHHAGDMWAHPMETKLDFPNPVVGTFQELALTVEDLDASMEFWGNLGFDTHGVEQSMYRYTHMYDGLLVLGLHETKGLWHGFTFTYSGHGVEENEAALKALQDAGFAEGVTPMEYAGQAFPGNYLIPDPAGNMFMLTTDLTGFKK